MRTIALFISGMFHPLFLPTYLGALAFWLQPAESFYYTNEVQLYILLQLFLISSVLPIGAVLLLIWGKQVSDIMVSERSQRSLPYLINAVCLAALFYNFRNLQLAPFITNSVLGALVSVLGAYFINFRWKISAHAIAMGGALGLLLALSGSFQRPLLPVFAGVVLLTGLVGTSRLLLQAHTPAQIYAGYALGMLSLYICLV